VTAGRAGYDDGLRHILDKVQKAGEQGLGHGVAHDDGEGEVGVGLGAQGRQRQRLERCETLFHPLGVIQKGLARLGCVMLDLEAAEGRVGEPAKADHLHPCCVHFRVGPACHARRRENGSRHAPRQGTRVAIERRRGPA